MIKVKEK